jgi:hypothetical protein
VIQLIQEAEFWAFLKEREQIRLRRLEGLPREQWTEDSILQRFSFTNVKRHHDRTTMLIDQHYYSKMRAVDNQFNTTRYKHACKDALLNAAIFRYHGTVETALDLGWHSSWDAETKRQLIEKDELRLALGMKVFTGAYIVPNAGDTRAKHLVVADVVDGMWNKADYILDTNSWQTASTRMREIHAVGPFMSKEVLLDYVLITEWVPSDWQTWTPIGPGALKGAAIVQYGVPCKISEKQALTICRVLYEGHEKYWPTDYVKLDLTDVQFQLCEYAKYFRTKTGAGRPRSTFRPTQDEITCRNLA